MEVCDARVGDEKVTYIMYTGDQLQPTGEWGKPGELFQDSATGSHIWFHDVRGWEEGTIDITPHPVHNRKLVLVMIISH
jgi:hypothetical protein